MMSRDEMFVMMSSASQSRKCVYFIGANASNRRRIIHTLIHFPIYIFFINPRKPPQRDQGPTAMSGGEKDMKNAIPTLFT